MIMINNDNKILKDIIIEYEKTTDTTLSTEKMTFTLGDVSSWTARQALESLEYEPEGNLAILLLYKAWQEKKYKERLSYKQILENPSHIEQIIKFDKMLEDGEAKQLLDNTIDNVKFIASKFNLNIDKLLEDNYETFIDIFAEAYENIYKKYFVDKFSCTSSSITDEEPFIGVNEYHFHSLRDFVNCLRKSNNCVAYARIDGLYDYDDANMYDTFFAFGCKCGNYVYINSEREHHATPSSRKIKNQRNPGKKLANKADSTWMPYYFLDKENNNNVDVEDVKQINLPTVIKEINLPSTYISNIYDEQARLIIVLSMALMYQKYFKQKVTEERRYNKYLSKWEMTQDSFFGEDIKLLPNNVCKALTVVDNELHLPSLTNEQISVVPKLIYHNDVTYYDWYYNEYIKDGDLQTSGIEIREFLGSKEAAEQRAWWEMRSQALPIINERRTKFLMSAFYKVDKNFNKSELEPYIEEKNSWGEPVTDGWHNINGYNDWILNDKNNINIVNLKDIDVPNKLLERFRYLVKICITKNKFLDEHNKNTICAGFANMDNADPMYMHLGEDDYPYLSTKIKMEENLPGYKWHLRNNLDYRSSWKKYSSKDCDLFANHSDSHFIYILPKGGGDNKLYQFTINCNSCFDIANLLGCKVSELPKQLQRFLSRKYSAKPYTGNSILDVTDPLDDVYDIVNEKLELKIILYLSKTDIKKYSSILNINADFMK